MSLLDIVIEGLQNGFTHEWELSFPDILKPIAGWFLIFSIIGIIFLNLINLLDLAEKRGFKKYDIQSWSVNQQFSFILSIFLTLILVSIPAALLVFNTVTDFLVTFIQIMVAMGTIMVVLFSLDAVNQSREATQKMQDEATTDRKIAYKMKQLEELYSPLQADGLIFTNSENRNSHIDDFLNLIKNIYKHIYLGSPEFQKAFTNWTNIFSTIPTDTKLYINKMDAKLDAEGLILLKIVVNDGKTIHMDILELIEGKEKRVEK